MYVFPEMLEMTKVEFPSEAHRVVAEKVLLANPRYHSLDALTDGAKLIAAIPADRIKLVTLAELHLMGLMVD